MEASVCIPEKRLGGRALVEAVSAVFGDLRGRLDGDLLAICYTQDGSVATVEEGGILRRWIPDTGELLLTEPLSETESCWAFSPDGKLLVSGSNNVSIWSAETGELLGRLPEPSWMVSLAFSPDGSIIASGHDDHQVRLWRSADGALLHTLACHTAEVCALAFRLDGKRLATAGEDRLVVIWDVETGEIRQKLEGHTDRIDALAWNLAGNRVVSAAWDTSVRVWDAETGDLLALLNGQGQCVHAVAFLPDGNRLVCGDSDCVVRLWEYEKLQVVAEFRGHGGGVRKLAVRPDGEQVASGGADRAVMFWNLPDNRPAFHEASPKTPVHRLIVGDEQFVALHSEGRLQCWRFDGHAEPIHAHHCHALAVAHHPLHGWALGSAHGEIVVAPALAEDIAVRWSAGSQPVRLLTFSGDGSILASSASTDGTIKLWNPRTGEPLLVIPEATEGATVESMALDEMGQMVAGCGFNFALPADGDGVIAVWDRRKPALACRLDGGASRVLFSPDGKLLAAISLYESIVVWDLQTQSIAKKLLGPETTTFAVAFDRENRLFAAGGNDGALRIWDRATFRLLATIPLETPIRDLAFTPDGQAVLTGNENSTCYRVELAHLPEVP